MSECTTAARSMPGVAAPGSAGRETITAPAKATTSPPLVSGPGMSPPANATTTGTVHIVLRTVPGTSLAEQACASLLDAIVGGDLPPESPARLVEADFLRLGEQMTAVLVSDG
jgi:hypothetical protein